MSSTDAHRRRPLRSRRCGAATRLLALLCIALVAPRATSAQFDLATATIADINAAIDAGALTSEQLVGLYLARIEAYDRTGPGLNTVITLNEQAVEEARALDLERATSGRRSPLHGIPVMLKDLIDVEGMPTTAGFVPFGAPVPLRDSTVASRLKAAGAIVLAKVSTTNWFGNGFDETHPIGPSINAYNADYSAGGSSNGPGVAMSAWFAALAIGTDTGGSVMIPSAYNSLAGMIATQGLVSRAGIVPRGGTQDRAGPMARNVYDLVVALGVIAGWDAEDFVTYAGFGRFPTADWPDQVASASLAGTRVGVLREMIRDDADPEVVELFEQALEDMRAQGALVIDPVLTGVDLATLATSAVGRTAEYEKLHVQNAYLARLGTAAPFASIEEMMANVGHAKFSRLMREALELPDPAASPDYDSRLQTRRMMIGLLEATLERYSLDALVLPFRSYPPPALAGDGRGGGNSLASNNGLPAIMVPGGYTSLNLPIGIQFVGGRFDDLTLLQVAHAYESASRRRKAPVITPPLAGERFEY